jgi:hypothetical protein
MRKTIFAILGSALLATTTVQFATAAHRHHGKTDRTVITQKQTRNADAYAAWPAAEPNWYRYSGGYSAPAGH